MKKEIITERINRKNAKTNNIICFEKNSKINFSNIKKIILFSILILMFCLVISSCNRNKAYTIDKEQEREENSNTINNNSQIANPASKFCIENNGKLEIRKDKEGNEFGVCIFSNVKECEEWAYFRGECSPDEEIKENSDTECKEDKDCVPATCCHPKNCVSRNNMPKCDNIACTMECRPGTLDCGNGECRCINGKCIAEIKVK